MQILSQVTALRVGTQGSGAWGKLSRGVPWSLRTPSTEPDAECMVASVFEAGRWHSASSAPARQMEGGRWTQHTECTPHALQRHRWGAGFLGILSLQCGRATTGVCSTVSVLASTSKAPRRCRGWKSPGSEATSPEPPETPLVLMTGPSSGAELPKSRSALRAVLD